MHCWLTDTYVALADMATGLIRGTKIKNVFLHRDVIKKRNHQFLNFKNHTLSFFFISLIFLSSSSILPYPSSNLFNSLKTAAIFSNKSTPPQNPKIKSQ
ncbi:hypothetical protein MtrunA17_Chr3g0124621 [Medicago truncatula]|uniref:Transmembrane protein n=1 Tax=Medicago truncatula TaxID=3880 RepID=A0A396J2H5_MEDTR|nr:hypothetical protein MtrunA17_Chr3g0124621 [Medicago truncatula]